MTSRRSCGITSAVFASILWFRAWGKIPRTWLAGRMGELLRGSTRLAVITAPIPATRHALDKTGMVIDDFDLFECNEAFASVPLAWMAEHDIPHEKVYLHPSGHAGYYPGAALISLKLLFSPDDGKMAKHGRIRGFDSPTGGVTT